VSVAVHDVPGEPQRAAAADFALLSPVFPPRSKPGDLRPTLGPQGFARLAAQLPCPAFALGGIGPHNAASVGAAGVALMSTVLHEVDDAWILALLSAMS
jgi:thiamine-phosphate pyrophosphorylase